MNTLQHVAIVGRPNVGKSRLFNRLSNSRVAIVHDEPGVTRDVNSFVVDDEFILLDTGGIGLAIDSNSQDLNLAVDEQIEFAIQAADIILFLVVLISISDNTDPISFHMNAKVAPHIDTKNTK